MLRKKKTDGTTPQKGTGRTSTLTFRIEPGLKETLRAAAEEEHRSIASMVEVMIRDYCGRNGVPIPEQGSLFDERRKPAGGH